MTWSELCDELTASLIVAGIDNASAEARWIVERVGGDPRATAPSDDQATSAAMTRAREMAQRRGSGEPLQYVLGEWSFRDFDVYLDARVLIPRPETELTAEVAIGEAGALGIRVGRGDPWAAAYPPADGTANGAHVADLGTGSGVLALALARELADVTIWASDISTDAIAVARANVAGAGTVSQRVRLVEGDWFGALPTELRGRLSLIVSNPPYIGDGEALPGVVVDHEPTGALFAGPTGLEDLEAIVRSAPEWLARPGTLVLEHAPQQARDLVELARALGYGDVEVRDDLAGRPRVLIGRLFTSHDSNGGRY